MAMRSALRSSLLVVSVVLMITTPQALLFNLSDIKDSVQPKAPVAEIGSPSFTFNCTVNQSSITAYDVVWKHYSVRLPPDWQHVVNATLIQLVIPNITEDSFGNYECRSRLENRLIGGAQLEVGYPPDQPKFERCQSNNLNDFTCWWNRGRDPILKTNYNLTYTFKVGKVRVCPDLRVKQNKLICSWNPSHGHPAMYGNEHRIVVTAENGLGKTTSVPKFLDPDEYGTRFNAFSHLHGLVTEQTSTDISQYVLTNKRPLISQPWTNKPKPTSKIDTLTSMHSG